MRSRRSPRARSLRPSSTGPGTDKDVDVDALGPVDWIVVEFPGSRFNGEIAPALADLVECDLVRVLDLVASGRIPVQAILAAIQAETDDEGD
jgi:hypothetical protein